MKYKVTDFGEHDDLYQVLSYARAAGLPEALLLYASASRPAERHVVRNDGTVIDVRYVDLAGSDGAILAEMQRTALVIERMAGAEG